MRATLLLATDLDRTLIANGLHPESPRARPLFDRVVARPEVCLAYVSGRDFVMIQDAIREYLLPKPHFLVTDVGASIWTWEQGGWQRHTAWDAVIAPGWRGWSGERISSILQGIVGIEKQEASRQGLFKLSYYWFAQDQLENIVREVVQRTRDHELHVDIIWSQDEITGEGFLDVLPKGASKLGAVRYLQRLGGFARERTIFSGDSGNDLDVLTSEIPAVLVGNAPAAVRQKAIALSQSNGNSSRLYLAKGAHGMNGYYSAGILEGLAHFIPETLAWIS
ncbi:MAG: HAD-IIB family hydrolase [Magnetococcales bacterium]|nr:HAD-IIB family hydrolase [Magnetococcales bacterium]